VPDDVGFCVLLQDLRGQSDDFFSSPFWEQLRRTPLGKSLLSSKEVRKLEKVEQVLEKVAGLSWARLRDEILGDAFVFAFRPDPAGRQERDQGLYLVRARSAKVLASLVEKVNESQKLSRELTALEEREHRGVKYFRRVEASNTNYYCVQGPILIFSGQEAILREAIERSLEREEKKEPAVARQLREMGLERAVLAVWLNPRAYDAPINEKGSKPDDPGARQFAALWKGLQVAGFGLELGKEIDAKFVVRARPGELPATARKFFLEASKSSELWKAIPEDPLLAVSGRVDFAALYDLLASFQSKESRASLESGLEKKLGPVLFKSFFKEVLPALGPDWGLCVLAPADPKSAAPRAWLALRLARGPEDDPVDQAVLRLLHFWIQAGVWAHNQGKPGQEVRMKSVEIDKLPARQLQGPGLPPGVQPTLILKGGYLVVGSSSDVVRRFGAPASVPPLPPTSGEVPLARISFRGWREYLKENREALAEVIAARESVSRESVRERLDTTRANLEPFERLEVRQVTAPGQVTVLFRLQTSAGSRK
jgi:hypothetical protein